MGILFESFTGDVLVALSFFVYILYRYSISTFGFWASYGVPYIPPVPFFGNSLPTALSLKSSSEIQRERYEFFGKNRFGGLYTFRKPVLFVKDPQLIEHILIKDFNTFYNRGFKADTKIDPLGNHLVNLEDAKWKHLRNKLTPTFSSGKLKGMQQQLMDCSDQLVDHLSKFESKGEPLELKNEMSKFTINVIASCAFGLSLNTFENTESEFKKMGEKVFHGSYLGKLRFALRSTVPSLVRLLRWKGLPQDMEDFFVSVVKNTVDYRLKNNVQRNDFLQLMMELRKQDQDNPSRDQDLVFNDSIMTANAFVFFLAGYDTTASTLSFLMYELAKNPIIQEQLYNEVQNIVKKHDGEISYEAVKEMKYLDQVVSETLRKHPPASSVIREARAPYKIPDTEITLPKGSMVIIPICGLHSDPNYYPQPEKFDPDRFAEGKEMVKGAYLPFGDGPRICIGLRFAKLEIKHAVIKIIQKFKVSVNEKTQEPLKFNSTSLLLSVVGGLWLNLHKRVDNNNETCSSKNSC